MPDLSDSELVERTASRMTPGCYLEHNIEMFYLFPQKMIQPLTLEHSVVLL